MSKVFQVNIFVLDRDPRVAAQMACDQHVVKMASETAQILSTACHLHGVKVGYRPSHAGHPCTLWAKTSKANFRWTLVHGFALCREYTYRYGKTHASQAVIAEIDAARDQVAFDQLARTPFVQVMPSYLHEDNAVVAYRNFYLDSKSRFARWRKNRPPPDWWTK